MKFFIFMCTIMFLSGCSTVGTPLSGMLFTSASGPTLAVGKTRPSVKGKACSSSIIGIATGDASILTAMKRGKIKKISHVDHQVTNILGIYAKYCTIVYGSRK